MATLRIATRGSAQARTQAEQVGARLQVAHPEMAVELVLVETTGDRRTDVPLHTIGGQGVFVKEVQQAVLDGRADLAVHSAKDLPSTPTPGLVIGALTSRRDPRDALIGCMFNDLAEGATVATGSVRRRAQLAARRPDLQFIELRGNIHTRLGKVPEKGAIVMAMAALEVLGISDELAATTAVDAMAVEVMVPQVGQGAVAVECATGDVDTLGRLASIDDEPTRLAVECERAFLAELGSGCSLPVGAYAVVDEADGLRMRTFLAGPDGIYEGVHEGTSVDAAQWAAEAAGFARQAVGA
ncbi:MAG TPA: hydroxymethylbilane synthase [Acidimicrobiales bacterium]|nr:hydroxymethylbilane synthase [Acidimicrobiales bacterium]